MDFIVELPRTKNGHNAILTFVDRLTKMTHLVPTTTNCDAVETAKLFMDHVFKHHGLPRAFVTDRGTQFTSGFSKNSADFGKFNNALVLPIILGLTGRLSA